MPLLRTTLLALTILLVAGYIGVDLMLPLPAFLYYENIAYAVCYAVLGYAFARGRRVEPLYVLLAGFNAGRVSRTVVTPEGSLGPLALQHVPLLAIVLAVAVLALLLIYRGDQRL